MVNDQGRSGTRGRATVAFMVAVGIVLAIVVVSYWRFVAKRSQPTEPTVTQGTNEAAADGAGSKTWDPQAAAMAMFNFRRELKVAEAEQRVDDELLRRAERIVETYPQSPEVYRLVAEVHMARQQWAEAHMWLTRSLDADQQQPDVHLLAGTIAMRVDKFDEAARHFDAAMGLVPDDVQPRLFLATLQQHQGDDDKALRTLLEARQVDTHAPQVYLMIADIYANQRKWSLAVTNIKHAIDNTPPTDRDTRAMYNLRLARYLNKWNKPEEAMLIVDALPGSGLRDPLAMEQRAIALAMLRKHADAAAIFERAAAMHPFQPRLMVDAVRQYILAGNKAGAEVALNHLRDEVPDQPEIDGLRMQIDDMADAAGM